MRPEDEAPQGGDAHEVPLRATERYRNREVEQVEFDLRVLALAADEDRALLERVLFLSISASNEDEFFQKRVGGLLDQVEGGAASTSADEQTPSAQLAAVRDRVAVLLAEQARRYADLRLALAKEGVEILDHGDLDEAERAALAERFQEQVFPVLTPLAVDPGRPFPFISNLSLNLAVVLQDEGSSERHLARVKIPATLPRFVPADEDQARLVPVEQVVAAHLHSLFPGMQLVEHAAFRVTRNADPELREQEADDLLATIEEWLLQRRFGRVVRLELAPGMSDWVRDRLIRELDISSDEVVVVDAPLDLAGLGSLHDLPRPDLKLPAWEPVQPPALLRLGPDQSAAIFDAVDGGDVLVHHPYESFEGSVQTFVSAAACDPQVVAIKVTIYRTSESEAGIVDALVRAVESGKQAVALIELKARFDEQANIDRARRLEEAGVHVVYGLVGLKTHTKTVLVVRSEGGRLRRYAHVGTGNYNPKTARLYEDIGVLTAAEDVGADVSELFNVLTGYSRQERWRRLLVAPRGLRDRVLELIEREAGHPDGHIVLKVNNLVDAGITEALYAASQKGCRIDLVVRTLCGLQPGVPGLSETIRVRSILGRFLEHSRLWRFGSAGRGFDYFIGSADLMPRNLDRRMEAVLPVTDERARERLEQILDLALRDDVGAWELHHERGWHKVETREGVSLQEGLMAAATGRAEAAAQT